MKTKKILMLSIGVVVLLICCCVELVILGGLLLDTINPSVSPTAIHLSICDFNKYTNTRTYNNPVCHLDD
jgi:hypothetical protein